MPKEINQLALDVSNDLVTETLAKGLPPKLLYRLRALAHKYGWKVPHKQIQNVMTNALTQKMEELNNLKSLKKNEVMASIYSNKTLKMDFGSEVSEEVKKKAMDWCAKKGLKVVEASMSKSENGNSYVVFKEGTSNEMDELVEVIRWES
jgi:hypothetical protein